MLNYTLGTIEASEALIKDLYIDLRAKVNAWSKITQQITNDGNIITDVFPSKNNTYSDVLLPLSSYSGSTTISVANIKNVIKKYSPSARVNGLNKEKLLQLLEDIRKNNNITNADLCNKFADEIYLPKIVLKKADIS